MHEEHVSSAEQAKGDRSTAPSAFSVLARGFDTEDHARRIAGFVREYVRVLGERFDLSQLDGVTVAYDYVQALADLDRGCESSHRLATSDGVAIGIAMTPGVIRENSLKSHIVLNAHYVA